MINLQIIIDGLEMVDDMNRVFFDTETNEIVYLSDSDPSLNTLMDADSHTTDELKKTFETIVEAVGK